MTGLATPPAERVLTAVGALTATLGQPPTLREIADEVGLAVSTTHHHVLHLLRDGLLVAEDRPHRYLRRADERTLTARAVLGTSTVTVTFAGDIDALDAKDAALVRRLLRAVEGYPAASAS